MTKNTILRVALPLAAVAALTTALLPGSGSALALTAPANTTEPQIVGDAIEGRMLTASNGIWSGTTPMSFAYRWLRCPIGGGAPDGADCGLIPDATASGYRVRDADVGLRIRVRVTATNADGSANMARLVADIRRELAATKLPQGFFTSLEGTFQAQEEASRTIAALSLLSLAMIFAILYSRYRSAVLALIIMGIAAAEAAVALSIIILIFKKYQHIEGGELKEMKD